MIHRPFEMFVFSQGLFMRASRLLPTLYGEYFVKSKKG
jgi:hypothetical protein